MRLLFLDIDTLRPDHMSCYGYHRQTTPNMDKVAEGGVRFDNYYTSDAPCLPSRAALISGQFGIHNHAVSHGGTCGDRRLTGKSRGFKDPIDCDNLHMILRKAGMHTASFSSFPERHSSWWFNAGLNECYNMGKSGLESGEEIVPKALSWLKSKGQEDDWYLHINIWDPHTPYRAPEEIGNPFENEPMDSWIDEKVFAHHQKHVGPHSIQDLNMYDDYADPRYPRQPGRCDSLEEVKGLMDNYDTGIYYSDILVGQIIDQLKELGVYEDTAIIITSDHGENMGELGIYAEHATADNITCKIPMIIKWPCMEKGQVNTSLHYSLDLLPTLADIFDVPKSNLWDGVSYYTALSQGEPAGRESLVISQNAHVCQRSARFGQWLYMRTYHDGYHLFPKEMLFNVGEDPYEQFNVAGEFPEICAKGAKVILDWHDDQLLKDPTGHDPMWTVLAEGGPFHTKGYLEDYLVRLEKTGRAEGAKMLKEKYVRV